MLHADLLSNHFLAVHTVHRTDHQCMSIYDFLDHWQCALQCSVFYRDDQKVNTFCLLRCLYMKIIFLIIDHDSIFLQTPFALSFCHDPQIVSQLFS